MAVGWSGVTIGMPGVRKTSQFSRAVGFFTGESSLFIFSPGALFQQSDSRRPTMTRFHLCNARRLLPTLGVPHQGSHTDYAAADLRGTDHWRLEQSDRFYRPSPKQAFELSRGEVQVLADRSRMPSRIGSPLRAVARKKPHGNQR